jgi:hypothetical protein
MAFFILERLNLAPKVEQEEFRKENTQWQFQGK